MHSYKVCAIFLQSMGGYEMSIAQRNRNDSCFIHWNLPVICPYLSPDLWGKPAYKCRKPPLARFFGRRFSCVGCTFPG